MSKANAACENEQDDEPKWDHCFSTKDVEIKENATFELAPDKSHINYVDFNNEWIIDSGCTNHVTRYNSLFSVLQQYKGERVIVMADNSTYPVMKECVVKIGISDTNIKLNDVYHVPSLKKNLVSFS